MAKEQDKEQDKAQQIKQLKAEIARVSELVERDKATRNKAEKDMRDGLRRIEELKSQLIDLAT